MAYGDVVKIEIKYGRCPVAYFVLTQELFTHHLLVAKSLAFHKIIYAPSDYLVDMLIREMKEAEQCGRFSVTMRFYHRTNGFIGGDVKINVILCKKI